MKKKLNKEKKIGQKIKDSQKFYNLIYFFAFLGFYFSGLIFLSAYIFWPRNTPIKEIPIDINPEIIIEKVEGDMDIPVEEKYFDFYKNILLSAYPNNNIQETDKGINLSYESGFLQIREIPNKFDPKVLEQSIRNILGNQVDNYGVYFYDFSRDIEVGVNEDMILPPMSISKLPVGVMMMREIDKGNFTLDSYYPFRASAVSNPTNVLDGSYVGTSFPIRDYLRFLIIDSDNSSIRMLEELMGVYLAVNEKVKNELGVNTFFRNPHDATAKDVGRVYVGLYNGEYLTPESNEFFINLLKNTHWSLQDGIPVGVPEPYKSQIAHKTGQGASVPGFIWEDSGIVYGEKADYVLVILNHKINIVEARSNIQQISALVWETTQ